MNVRHLRITVREGYGVLKFTRRTIRSLARELKLLWFEYPNAKQIELEIIK